MIRVTDSDLKGSQRFHREVRVWREIWSIDRGRYILPFYGVCFQDGPCPYVVGPL
jgi:hypothetical protein